jgi:hypothetical protein
VALSKPTQRITFESAQRVAKSEPPAGVVLPVEPVDPDEVLPEEVDPDDDDEPDPDDVDPEPVVEPDDVVEPELVDPVVDEPDVDVLPVLELLPVLNAAVVPPAVEVPLSAVSVPTPHAVNATASSQIGLRIISLTPFLRQPGGSWECSDDTLDEQPSP